MRMGMQDLHRDASEDLTIDDYRRKSIGDLQKAMRGLFGHLRCLSEGRHRLASLRFQRVLDYFQESRGTVRIKSWCRWPEQNIHFKLLF